MSSPAMELEGLVRGLKFLSDANLYVDALVTDQHQGITKYMREQQSTIRHYYDAWHVVKGTTICCFITVHSLKQSLSGKADLSHPNEL